MSSRNAKNPANDLMVRVLFHLDPNAWHGSATERLWATPIGPGVYRLENTPFFATGVSFEDEVKAEDHSGELEFIGVVRHSGRSTYRILPSKNWAAQFEVKWEPLKTLGCTYEEGPKSMLAVDVPPAADIYRVYNLLEDGESSEVWSFEEGHCGHPLNRQPDTEQTDPGR